MHHSGWFQPNKTPPSDNTSFFKKKTMASWPGLSRHSNFYYFSQLCKNVYQDPTCKSYRPLAIVLANLMTKFKEKKKQRMGCKAQPLNCIQESKRQRRGKGIQYFQKKYTSAAFSLWKRTLHKYPYKTISYCNNTSTQVLQAAALQLPVLSL